MVVFRLLRNYSVIWGHNIRHRGPDDEGIYSEQGFGCVHRRLSIIDLATGQQPMLSQDANLVLVFNGEIFNFVELREQLVTQGYQFTTQSDTEVILHLYQRDGLDFVSHLNGQFAIALWDKRIQQLLLIRDRVWNLSALLYNRSGSAGFWQ